MAVSNRITLNQNQFQITILKLPLLNTEKELTGLLTLVLH